MKNLRTGLGVAVTAAALLAASTLSASAADTDVTFQVIGGSLSITAPGTDGTTGAPADLPAVNAGETEVSGALGATAVADTRALVTGSWTVSASTSEFTNGTTTASTVSYTPGAVETRVALLGDVTTTATPQILRDAGVTAGTELAVVTGADVLGVNDARWDPTLTVTLPANSTAGIYTGTITTSVV
jgi:hypothetical protein